MSIKLQFSIMSGKCSQDWKGFQIQFPYKITSLISLGLLNQHHMQRFCKTTNHKFFTIHL